MADLGYSGSETGRGDAVFDGAKYRLARIAFEAPAARDRTRAVLVLTFIADSQFTLDVLRSIALSDDEDTAYQAVARLSDTMKDKGGLDVLRELWLYDYVVGINASRSLNFVARRNNWK